MFQIIGIVVIFGMVFGGYMLAGGQFDVSIAFGPDTTRLQLAVKLDEPAGGVNPTMLGALKERLKAINAEEGATFVVIEHNMDFVMSLCTRVIVLAEGRIGLDIAIPADHPRDRGSAELARIEGQLLDAILSVGD